MEDKKYVGTVVWFSNELNYGFIKWENEQDIFVYWSDIEIDGFKTLKKDDKVVFSVGKNNSGNPKATKVVIIDGPSTKNK